MTALMLISGLSHADYEDGVLAAQNGDYETAYREFLAAADEGLMMAQYNLGILYFSGRGVEQDFTEALRWTRAAAEQGHAAAQFNLGALYYEGHGTHRDREEALAWYIKAGDADHVLAQFNVADMYYRGVGTDKDMIRAHAWATRALENGHETVADLLDDIEKGMNETELREARRLLARMKIGMDR